MAEIVDQAELLAKLRGFSPLRRLLLAVPGTLQSTLSAYFGHPVTVSVISQVPQGAVIRRAVHLVCDDLGMVVVRAVTDVTVADPDVRALVEAQTMGLGQIVASLAARTNFELEDVGRGSGTFWRRYRLEGPGFTYLIREEFPTILYADVHAGDWS
jgi:chorismate-pyruvate lyase